MVDDGYVTMASGLIEIVQAESLMHFRRCHVSISRFGKIGIGKGKKNEGKKLTFDSIELRIQRIREPFKIVVGINQICLI